MTLSIAAIPQSHWRNLIPLLEALGWKADQQDPESWYLESQTETSGSNRRYILLHERPEFVVARAIEAGQRTSDALQQWCSAVDALFTLHRTYGQNAIMLDIHSVPGNEQTLLDWLAEHRSDWQARTTTVDSQITVPDTPQLSALPLFLAREVVSHDETLAPRLRRLEAMSIPLTEGNYEAPGVESAVLLNAYRQQLLENKEQAQNTEELKEQLETAKTEEQRSQRDLEEVSDRLQKALRDIEVSNSELASLQAQTDGDKDRCSRLEQELELKSAELEQHKRKLDQQAEQLSEKADKDAEIRAELESAQKTNERLKQELEQSRENERNQLSLLELQLAQVQEELEQSEQHKAQLEQKLQGAAAADEATDQKNHDALHEELQRVQEKLALTEKNLGRELKDTKAENELLILQIHQVQEELEALVLREQSQQKEAQSLKDQVEAKAQEVNQLKASETQVQSDLKQKRAELDSVRAELSLVKGHLKNTQDDLKVQHHRNEQLEHKLLQQQNEAVALNNRITEKNQKLQKLSQGKKQAVAERDELNKLKQAAEHRNNLLETELDKLHRSFTYRLASPVRMIGDVAGAVHRPSRQQKTIKQQAALIEDSGLFDEAWYLDRYPDVLNTDLKPAEHYLKHGAAEGRDPSEHFSTRWYLKKYPDVAESSINPVLHYILYGKEEKRMPLPAKKK